MQHESKDVYRKDTIVIHSRGAGLCQLIFLYFSERKPGAIDFSCLSNLIIFYHLILCVFFLSVVLAESCVNDKLGCHTDEIIVHIT